MCASETSATPSSVTIEPLDELLRALYDPTPRRTIGATRQKERGNGMAENISPTLFFDDGIYRMWRYPDGVVLCEPVTAPNQFCCDRAVHEAGFATEPLRHLIAELYNCLYLRMLEDPIKGFTNQEWEACQRAREELGITPAYRGPETR